MTIFKELELSYWEVLSTHWRALEDLSGITALYSWAQEVLASVLPSKLLSISSRKAWLKMRPADASGLLILKYVPNLDNPGHILIYPRVLSPMTEVTSLPNTRYTSHGTTIRDSSSSRYQTLSNMSNQRFWWGCQQCEASLTNQFSKRWLSSTNVQLSSPCRILPVMLNARSRRLWSILTARPSLRVEVLSHPISIMTKWCNQVRESELFRGILKMVWTLLLISIATCTSSLELASAQFFARRSILLKRWYAPFGNHLSKSKY